jgi:beta-lactam-binding protein with PASTA domain/tRNA A-37 threonylcarbamoyl transferase component Bud32
MPGSAVSDLAGRVLASRYLLHSAIGTGASGRVYVAEDTRLRRRVAVKVLHAALADDTAFLRRFRAEAQLAASLHHPHIVTVHDWGEDDVPFMVLELLEGGSLRGMLDQGNALTVGQAARVGRDVASALHYAHARGVLHRDIKPANLLFDEHGIVRVADFGLARALAEASWTEPAGAVFGTARYASPEQALGIQLDARSDLYSLALVLVESVTDRVPFAADTTLGTLTARTQRSLTAPETLGPLAPVVERAGALDPAQRYPDAGTMRQALADAGESLPPPAPLILAGMIDSADPHPTRAVPKRDARFFDQDAIEVVHEPLPEPTVVEPKERITGHQRRLVPFVVAFALLLAVAIGAAGVAHVRSGRTIAVPRLVGLDKEAAIAEARDSGLNASVGPTQHAPDPVGRVIRTDPAAGEFTTNHHVTLIVSSGPAKVPVPNIVGKQWSDAKPLLDDAGVRYDDPPAQQFDEHRAKGVVLRVTPHAGVGVLPDTKVDVLISKGHAPVKVPAVAKLAYTQASDKLKAAHFTVKPGDDAFSETVAKGSVIASSPAAGHTAPYGSTVTLVVSKGPEMVTVPDVEGLKLSEAISLLNDKGLSFDAGRKARPNDVVASQDPSPNSSVPKNSTTVVLKLTHVRR